MYVLVCMCVLVRTMVRCEGLSLIGKCTCKRSLPRTFYNQELLTTVVPDLKNPIAIICIPICVYICMWECGVVLETEFICLCIHFYQDPPDVQKLLSFKFILSLRG